MPPNLPEHGALTLPEQPIITLSGLSTSDLSIAERASLLADFTNDEVDIKPTGECYVSHIHLRKRLSLTLGAGAWGLQPMGKPEYAAGNWMVMTWALFIRGRALSWTWGGARYQKDNPRASWSDALETTKSDALSRLCKDIPMGGQCWDRRHNSRFRRETCVLVFAQGRDKVETWWRTLDRDPFPTEKGVHPESPNADKYHAPVAARASSDPFIDAEVSTQGTGTTGTEPLRLSEPQIRRVLKIARDSGWKKGELIRFFMDTCKLKPATGKPDDCWHLAAAIFRHECDKIVATIQAGTR